MDVVRVFNSELTALYENKPPISKAKMTQITKSAIKGIKFYKHVVQSVEKFIQKCRPEYKVPGLYVVDSIVRQSRHQFGSEKDVFGPRFVKNITTTFQYLFRCPEDDRPKIIRVLNLWQKNSVFPIDVIQPLLDMGNPNSSTDWPGDAINLEAPKDIPPVKSKEEQKHKSSDSWKGWPQSGEEAVSDNKTYAEISTKNLEKFNKAEMANAMKEEEISRALYKNQMKLDKGAEEVKFNQKLLEFDYGDEEDEEMKKDDGHLSNQPNALALSMAQNFLSDPDLLRRIQMAASATELLKDLTAQTLQPKPEEVQMNYPKEMQNSPQVPAMPPLPFPDSSNLLQFQFDKNGVPYQTQPPMPMMEPMNMEAAYPPVMTTDQHLMQNSQGDEDERVMYSMPGEPPLPPQDYDERQIMLPDQERSRKDRSRSRSGSRSRGRSSRRRSRSRSPRRKRSRSRSHSRKNRSRSRERERIREKERERERERERRRKGIPPIKKGCVSVCSTTLWLGHVPKSCSEVDISNTFGQYGTILSIDMIPPRGCAYVVMDRRQDGYRILQKCKNAKLQGSTIKMAWAPGKGVKGKEYKDYWEVDLGVSYVPFEKTRDDPEVLDLLEEGGFIDEDSLPEHLKALRKPDEEKQLFNASNKATSEVNASYGDMQTAPNMVPPPIIPPTSVNIPMVLPHMMQPQFGLPLPGMLPPQAMVMQVPMGIPPPAPMLMVQQQSQGILNNQPLPMVGGVPQIASRTIPPATSALPNLKSSVQTESVVPAISSTAGDATPTEEEGTSVSTPSVQMSIPSSVSVPAVQTQTSQPAVSISQFNQILGMNANRPLLSVPPPVSTSGTPIPYPPPHMGFGFPPPGIRHPGQAHTLPPNPQFPWIQKQMSPYTDGDSSQSTTAVRAVPPPQHGMPVHMFSNRPPFQDPQTSVSNVNSMSVKDSPVKGRDNGEHKDGLINRNVSPGHHDRIPQEMAISTDDESSMDIDYPRNDMSAGPLYPGVPEFPRTPLNMQRMRGLPLPMPPGPRFRGMPMGSPFPMRMAGPRGMGGPGMLTRMEMEFPPHHGSQGPRMPMGPHPPRRNDMHGPPDGRDWYPRDFESPHERERDRHFRDDWKRDSWEHEDSRHNSRDRDEGRRDDQRESWNHERVDTNKSSRDVNSVSDKISDKNDSGGKAKDKPTKSKSCKGLMNELMKMRNYQRGGPITNKPNRSEQSKDKPPKKVDRVVNNEIKKPEASIEKSTTDMEVTNESNLAAKKERDREARKRSRWGRTLSEEREIQEQKRFEAELKFQGFEQSHTAQHSAPTILNNPLQNSNEGPKKQPGGNIVDTQELIQKVTSMVDTQKSIQNITNIVDTPESIQNITNMVDKHELIQNLTNMVDTQESIQNVTNMVDTPESIQNVTNMFDTQESIQNVASMVGTHESMQNISNMMDTQESMQNVSNIIDTQDSIQNITDMGDTQKSIHNVTNMVGTQESNQDITDMVDTQESIQNVANMVLSTQESVQNFTNVIDRQESIQNVTDINARSEVHSEPNVQNEVHMSMQQTFVDMPVESEQFTMQNNEICGQDSSLSKLLENSVFPTNCTDASAQISESLNPCNMVENSFPVTGVTESSTTSLCTESMDDSSVNNSVSNSTSNDNIVADDAIPNNSLISSES